jgi:hypothetical protein
MLKQLLKFPRFHFSYKNNQIYRPMQESVIKPNFKAKILSKFSNSVEDYQVTNSEKSIVHNILQNPDTKISLTEVDIHSALKKSGTLPEDELKIIINDFRQDGDIATFQNQLDKQILKKLNHFLNKSIVEVTKISKNTNELKGDKRFWQCLEDELFHRTTSLTNDQVTDILSNFGKCEVDDLKIFDDYEEVINESDIPFLVIYVLI